MKNIQRYFFIDVPNPNALVRFERASIGENVNIIVNPSKDVVFIKTNTNKMESEVKKNESINRLFHGNGKEVTYMQAYETLKTWEDKTPEG